MIRTLAELQAVLQGTSLENERIYALPVDETEEEAFAIEVSPNEALDAWQFARGLVDKTGRWPIVTLSWMGKGEDGLRESRYFSRFEYQHGDDGDVSPAALIARAAKTDVDALLLQRSQQALTYSYSNMEEWIDQELENLEDQLGQAPAREEIEALRASGVDQRGDIERWLLRWEAERSEAGELHDGYLDWFESSHEAYYLLFLPTRHSYEALAYLHFFNSDNALAIALPRRWHERFGAELVCHYGTMLQFVVERPPEKLEDALQLAWEQEKFAECTTILPGIPLVHHARVLIGRDQWFLHERP